MQDVVISGEKKVKDFLNTIQELCGENYIWVLTGAVVLAVLIIAAAAGAAIKAFRRKKQTASERPIQTENTFLRENTMSCLNKEPQMLPVHPTHPIHPTQSAYRSAANRRSMRRKMSLSR